MERAEWLVKHGADVNAKNDKGETPLQLATYKGHTAIVEFLEKYIAHQQANNAIQQADCLTTGNDPFQQDYHEDSNESYRYVGNSENIIIRDHPRNTNTMNNNNNSPTPKPSPQPEMSRTQAGLDYLLLEADTEQVPWYSESTSGWRTPEALALAFQLIALRNMYSQ